MAVGYNFNPYTPSYQNTYANVQPQVQPVPQNNGIVWVQGESGAKSYMVGAGNSVLLMDSESEVFYIKSTDPSGMPLPLRVFEYKERTQKIAEPTENKIDFDQFVTKAYFEQRLAELQTKEKKEDRKNGKSAV